MRQGWIVTAQDIIQWTKTNRRQAQSTLPLLVRKLIIASVNPTLLNIPAGDSISVAGWDGILKVKEGNMFVPQGDSVWEFGTNARINIKANEDYEKRTKDPRGLNKKKNTFIFVTSQTWNKRSDWEKNKNCENEWAQVKGLNADDLETWLEQCPAVHRWFSRLIGKRPEGTWDIEQAWDGWSNVTQPACNMNLVLAGRQDQVDDLEKRLKGEASTIRISGESEDEAYAFALAVIKSNFQFSTRLLVVREVNEWDILIDSQQPLILIPQFDNPHNLGLATKRGNWIILPASSMHFGARKADISLRRPDRVKQITALIMMGLDEGKAKEIVNSSRGYLNPIRRHAALVSSDYIPPNWATSEHAGLLLAALFAGSWVSDNNNDCDKLAQLANISYSEFETLLQHWRIENDRPIDLVGNVWQIISRQDVWSLLCQFINTSMLRRFEKTAKEVMLEIDPRFELPPDERWQANVRGKLMKHSNWLRHGLIEMMAILANYGDRDCRNIGVHSIQDQVSYWINQLLLEDMSTLRWASLAKELPLLAEAAPETFIEAIDIGLQGKDPPGMELFVEEGIMGGCTHAGLLWALEGISWNLKYLTKVALILAKLDRLDPGGSYTNRPFNTLKAIFNGLMPQTKASLDERLAVLDSIINFEPETGWKLLLGLIQKDVSIFVTPIHKPYFRDWDEGWKKEVSKDYHPYIIAISERVLKLAFDDPDTRLLQMIEKLPDFPKKFYGKSLEKLGNIDWNKLSANTSKEIRNKLREIISRHREFSDSTWALSKEDIEKLDEIFQKLNEDDLINRNKFLFDEYLPNLTNITSSLTYEQKQKMIDQTRIDSLEAIWRSENSLGIKRLAAESKAPWCVGSSIAETDFADEIEDQVLSWLGSDNHSLAETAKAYVSSRSIQSNEWSQSIYDQYSGTWSDRIWAFFCLGLPFNEALFDFLELFSDGVKKLFWKDVRRYYLKDEDAKYGNWVIEQLLAHNRPFAAINAAANYLHTISHKTPLSGDILARTLELAATDPSDHDTARITNSYDFVKVLKAIRSDPNIEEKRLALIEWKYVRIFRFNDLKPVALQNMVINNPSFFVYIICLMYKGNPPIEGEFPELSTEMRKQLAENSWYLLELVDKLPGQEGSDEINSLQLQEWIEKVRKECEKLNRKRIGDEHIGKLLSNSPYGHDGIWPHEVVRNIIEKYASKSIEQGMEVGIFNQRGVTSRVFGEGGKQEREIANRYDEQADQIKYRWPRTAVMLARIAKSYKHLATMMDLDDKLQE